MGPYASLRGAESAAPLLGTGDGSWAIALRCGQIEGDRIRLFAGCGIVADSVAIDEGIESEAKLVPMREALA